LQLFSVTVLLVAGSRIKLYRKRELEKDRAKAKIVNGSSKRLHPEAHS
jgi:hypothetical protein